MIRFDVQCVPVTGSTNDDIKVAARAGAKEGLVVWAREQTAGRGREGRTWASPPGNLYFSLLLRPTLGPKAFGFYSFLAALSIADAVEASAEGKAVELKWPNDVLIDGKKVSGVLLEVDDDVLVVGIGINILNVPANPLYPVTSLSEAGSPDVNVRDVLDRVLTSINKWQSLLLSNGFEPLRQEWLRRARKGPLRVRTLEGNIYGEFDDLDEQGRLRLTLSDKSKRSFNTGDVFF